MKQVINAAGICLVILICLLFLFPASVGADEYYVNSENGTDDVSHGGSTGTGAWQTLHWAVDHLTDGDVLNVAAGEYCSGEVGCSEANAELIVGTPNVTIRGEGADLTIIRPGFTMNWLTGIEVAASNVTIRDLQVKDFWGEGGIVIGSSTGSISDCKIYNNGTTGIFIPSGTGNIIEGCEIYGNNDYGIRIDSGSSNNIIRNNCRIYHQSMMGIWINGSSGNEIYGNQVYDNYGGESGIDVFGSTAQDNSIHHNDIYWTGDVANEQEAGIHFWAVGSGNQIFENNIYNHVYGVGIGLDNCSPTIRKNHIYDNDTGIDINASSSPPTHSPDIRNNYIYDTGGGASGDGIYVSAYGGGIASPTIYHNTIDGGGSYGIYIADFGGGSLSPDIRYNIVTNFGEYGIYCNSDSFSETIDYNDVWQNASGNYSTCSPGTNDINQPVGVDPVFALGSYQLQSTSPCIDYIPLTAGDPVTEDIDGNPRPQGRGYDIGAYEQAVSTVETVPVPPGTEIPEYIMVSFTVEPEDPSCPSVFGDDMGEAYNPENFRIGGYDATLGGGGYRECDTGLMIEPGYAYWMLARNGLMATVHGFPANLGDTEVPLLYSAATGNGWNQIGCPNAANYMWETVEVLEGGVSRGTIADASTDGLIDKRLWCWEAGTYHADAILMEQGQGYWVRAMRANVSLMFRQSAQMASLSNQDIMFARLLRKGKRWVKRWLFGPPVAIADSGDTPPMPMGGIAAPVSEQGGGGGCFIGTTTRRLLVR